jgi:hypothetical protein
MPSSQHRIFLFIAGGLLVLIGLYQTLARDAWLDGGGNILVGLGLPLVAQGVKGSAGYRTGLALVFGGIALLLAGIVVDVVG